MTTHGRLRLMALRDQTDAHAADMARQRERFTALAGREAVRAVSAFNLFQTPEAIADMMIREAFILDGMRILEPSAGLGRLYRATCSRPSRLLVLGFASRFPEWLPGTCYFLPDSFHTSQPG